MKKQDTDKISEYHLNLNQPKKPQFTMFDLGEYLKEHIVHASKAHIHSFYQIIWFRGGRGRHFVDFKEYEVTDNSIFFIAKNQVHYFDGNPDYRGILIHFNEPFLVQKDSEFEFFLNYDLFNNPYQQPSCCVGSGIDHILEGYLELMKAELVNPEAFAQEELLRIYLKAFMIQVQRRRNEFQEKDGKAASQIDEKRLQLMRFINMIDENYKKGFTVAEYAQALYVSARTLADLTNQLVGKSPSLMIQERIILEAQRMLLHSPLNVNQIGYSLGFDDASYFVKYFKKHTGISPSEFRRSVS
ncbi:helix-turn-helix domain-containing protein [Mucilaginibacter sp. R-33]|uniref:helix-turn-helix domain-containing protein n=1 Tax=unclassified Mucilaginibacter TaxID=2617802 RepID=UPI003CF7B52A